MVLSTLNKKCFTTSAYLFAVLISAQSHLIFAQSNAVSTAVPSSPNSTAVSSTTERSSFDKPALVDRPTLERNERWYQVEMIIFSRSESNPQEQWPKDIKLSYPTNIVNLKSGASDESGFSLLPQNERLLNAQASTIARSGSYSLLFHQAWRQMIYSRNTNILITGGKPYNSHQELEGSISLSVAQFLKVQTNFWLTQFSPLGVVVEGIDGWPELPPLPNTFDHNEKPADYVTKRIVKIAQQRTMRSNEVHYIDHPLLGIVIKIVPYDAQPGNAN
ncbi:MAG: hypothetical protein EOO68_08850 [Moraxellaceae bacterium]|nr:MAG: hypothetical protein EOO68_08850 [Moraxellaceae bacterium]